MDNPTDRPEPENALVAGPDIGARNCAVIASLIETCKPNSVEAPAYQHAESGSFCEVAQTKDILLAAVRGAVCGEALPLVTRDPSISASLLSSSAGLLGQS